MPTAIIIGASSGIGREIAIQLGARGFRLAIAARRQNLLEEVVHEVGPDRCIAMAIDLSEPDGCISRFHTLVEAVGPVNYVYLVAGTGHLNPELRWDLELETLQVNCLGFAALALASVQVFKRQNHGHLAAITSVAAARASASAPAYGASKRFESDYLEALRCSILKERRPISVTEVRPGFVNTAMMKAEKPFWIISAAVAARRIIRAAERRDALVYVPRRWRFVAAVMRILPPRAYARIA